MEALYCPIVEGVARVFEAVVDAVCSALPEFDGLRDDAESAPPVRFRDFSPRESLQEGAEFIFEDVAGGDDFALFGDPSTDAASDRAAQEVSEGLGCGDFFCPAADGDLAFEGEPRKEERSVWVFFDLVGFAAPVIGEKNEAPFVVSF